LEDINEALEYLNVDSFVEYWLEGELDDVISPEYISEGITPEVVPVVIPDVVPDPGPVVAPDPGPVVAPDPGAPFAPLPPEVLAPFSINIPGIKLYGLK
jgi:hypothetical protein